MSLIGYVDVPFTSYYVKILAMWSTALTGEIIARIPAGNRSDRNSAFERARARKESIHSIEIDCNKICQTNAHHRVTCIYIASRRDVQRSICDNAHKILTHNLKLHDIAVAIAFDVAGDTSIISGLGPIHLSESQAILLDDHAVLRVILDHVSLEHCAFAIRSKYRRYLYERML